MELREALANSNRTLGEDALRALKVFTLNERILKWLTKNDPKALEQAQFAIVRVEQQIQINSDTLARSEQDYQADALSDARETVSYFEDEIVEQLVDSNEAGGHLHNDYTNGDSYHHESHVDKSYNLQEAATILDQLSDYAETDTGLWESLEPVEAISAQAAYTYGNAVVSEFQDLIGKINSEWDDATSDLDDDENDCEERRERKIELQDADELDDEEKAELAALEKTVDHDSEEAVAARKKAKAVEIVTSIIKGE